MNYIEFEIGGKLRGFKFGLGFLGEIQKHFDVDFVELQKIIQKNTLLFVPAMLYYGHKHACLRKKIILDFEIYDFEDWISDLKNGISNENILHCVKAMNAGVQHISGAVEDETEEDSKKK